MTGQDDPRNVFSIGNSLLKILLNPEPLGRALSEIMFGGRVNPMHESVVVAEPEVSISSRLITGHTEPRLERGVVVVVLVITHAGLVRDSSSQWLDLPEEKIPNPLKLPCGTGSAVGNVTNVNDHVERSHLVF